MLLAALQAQLRESDQFAAKQKNLPAPPEPLSSSTLQPRDG
jgi:hypothetical protein